MKCICNCSFRQYAPSSRKFLVVRFVCGKIYYVNINDNVFNIKHHKSLIDIKFDEELFNIYFSIIEDVLTDDDCDEFEIE